MEPQDQLEQKELLEAQYNRLLELEANPVFRQWRDEAEASFLNEIESAKLSVLTMSEADVKALILYEAKIKPLFSSFRAAVEMRSQENKK